MGANWGEEVPEHQGDWSWFDFAVIATVFVTLVVIGVWTAGGPS